MEKFDELRTERLYGRIKGQLHGAPSRLTPSSKISSTSYSRKRRPLQRRRATCYEARRSSLPASPVKSPFRSHGHWPNTTRCGAQRVSAIRKPSKNWPQLG